jgi:hypothetical protein
MVKYNVQKNILFRYSKCLAVVILINLLMTSTSFARELIFSLDLVRHGDRTPIWEIPNSPHVWNEGLGELTALGAQQEMEVGQSMRKKYVDTYHLLSSHYEPETMYVRSTDINRTKKSAEAFLSGLYPENTRNRQFIPINVIPKSEDYVLLPTEAYDQRVEGELFSKYVASTPAWQDIINKLSPKFSVWSQVTGFSFEFISQIESFGDILRIRKLHNVSLPREISEEEAALIIKSARWRVFAKFQPPEIGDYNSQAFFKVIFNYLQDASQSVNHLKYVLFMGHEITLLSVMSGLHVPLQEVPEYASDLNFSLFRTEQNQYEVQVSFNNHPIVIPGCDNQFCALSRFEEIIYKKS